MKTRLTIPFLRYLLPIWIYPLFKVKEGEYNLRKKIFLEEKGLKLIRKCVKNLNSKVIF